MHCHRYKRVLVSGNKYNVQCAKYPTLNYVAN